MFSKERVTVEENLRENKEWEVMPSRTALQTFNPIRHIVDSMNLKPHPEKDMIHLSIGDPTVFGNLSSPKAAVEAIKAAAASGIRNGYSPSAGYLEAREAVARHLNDEGVTTKAEDVFLTSGCSSALEIAITVLVNPGENILIPCPGFSLYKTLCFSQGIGIKSYNCLPEKKWEADLAHMESLADNLTRAIVIVNPSNPCGSNFSKEHLADILAVAEKLRIPVISDEIYAGIVFKPLQFTMCASRTTTVPVLTCGGISKRFLVPGWRLGWVVMHDKNNVLGEKIRDGLLRLTQRILGPCTLVQAALPEILEKVEKSFHDRVIEVIQANAEYAVREISKIKGLTPIQPEAAFYMMVKISIKHFPEFKNEVEFTERMVAEQSVFCLPAKCFDYPSYFRIVLTAPIEKLEEACERMRQFCEEHFQD